MLPTSFYWRLHQPGADELWVLQAFRDIEDVTCERFPPLWIQHRIVHNLHHAVKIYWSMQFFLKYHCPFLLQHCSGWKGKTGFQLSLKHDLHYGTVCLLRWWVWSSCPSSPGKALPSLDLFPDGLPEFGTTHHQLCFLLPLRAFQSTCNSSAPLLGFPIALWFIPHPHTHSSSWLSF